jgi:hypothetical protein
MVVEVRGVEGVAFRWGLVMEVWRVFGLDGWSGSLRWTLSPYRRGGGGGMLAAGGVPFWGWRWANCDGTMAGHSGWRLWRRSGGWAPRLSLKDGKALADSVAAVLGQPRGADRGAVSRPAEAPKKIARLSPNQSLADTTPANQSTAPLILRLSKEPIHKRPARPLDNGYRPPHTPPETNHIPKGVTSCGDLSSRLYSPLSCR